MRSLTKLFFISSFFFLVVFLYVTFRGMKNTQLQTSKIFEIEQNLENLVEKIEKDVRINDKNIKYILQWTSPKNVPFEYMGIGQAGFIDRKCEYTNCYVTSDRNFLGEVTKFDVIAFAGPEIAYWSPDRIKPKNRAPHQKYAFANIESASNYPICSNELDNFFNWTWTFRLDSESRWGYIIVRDANGKIVGPKTEMHWMKLEDMDPVKEDLKNALKNKHKAAAWFVSNCRTKSGREKFVKDLQKALDKYKLKVDIYGKCGPLKCSRANEEECFQLIKKDYYFYLSLENSFSKDYVTEKLLHGLRYNAVPIVYGGANYTRIIIDFAIKKPKKLHPDAKNIILNTLKWLRQKKGEGYSSIPINNVLKLVVDMTGTDIHSAVVMNWLAGFMPDGIYLNGGELGADKLASTMKFLIDNPEEYEQYFRWTNHYSYYRRAENVETDDYCGFCKLLNDEEMVKKTSVYKNFKEWWNDPGRCP